MKTILCFLFVSCLCYGQNYFDYKRVDIKGCKILKFKDDFEKTSTYRTDFVLIANGNYGSELQVMMFNHFNVDNNSSLEIIFFGKLEACKDAKSYVDILMTDGSKIRLLNNDQNITCGSSTISVTVDNSTKSILLSSTIEKVRLSYSDANEDFNCNEKSNKKFNESLKCISNITNQ